MNLLEILKSIRNGEYEKHCYVGTCTIIYRMSPCTDRETNLNKFHKLGRGWPLFSGDVNTPINDIDSELMPIEQYTELPHWEGKQLELRLNLLDYCISVLEEEQT